MRAMWTGSIAAASACLLLLAGATTAGAADPAATYKAKCQMCHGPDGAGSVVGKKLGAKDLRLPDVTKLPDAQLFDLTKNGRNKMPAFDQKLSDDEIKSVLKYVRTLKEAAPGANADQR
jgi:cytochrome c6